VEQRLAWIATRQKGVVSRGELLSAGLSSAGIERRIRKGLLIPEFPGVYRVGHSAPSTEARYLAAVKACGDGAVLAGRAAAYLMGLIRSRIPPEPEVIASTRRRIEGVRTKHCRHIDRRDVWIFNGIRTTTVPRTLVDLAAILSLSDLARACHEAGVRYRTTPRQVDAVLARRPRAKGAGNLRLVMGGEEKVTLSKLESAFLALLKANGLPLPEMNRHAGSKRVDCRWPDHKLTVELNSYRFHNSRHAYEQDHIRQREARLRGDDFRTYTYGDVLDDSRAMLRELRTTLAPEEGWQSG
jgi:hypothetical protein